MNEIFDSLFSLLKDLWASYNHGFTHYARPYDSTYGIKAEFILLAVVLTILYFVYLFLRVKFSKTKNIFPKKNRLK